MALTTGTELPSLLEEENTIFSDEDDYHSKTDFVEGEEELVNRGVASIRTTVLNMCNNMIGVGLLSLPWAFRESSLLYGFLLILLIGVLSGLSFFMIAICCELVQKYTFRELGEKTLGRSFGTLMQATMFLYTFGSCLSYLIVTGDLVSAESGIANSCLERVCISESFIGAILKTRWKAVCLFAAFIMLPLSSFRNLSSLRFTSFLSLLGVLYVFVILFLLNWEKSESEERSVEGFDIGLREPDADVLVAAPIIIVAFAAHYNIPRYYLELENRSLSKFAKCILYALLICLVLYVSIATCGYMMFGIDTASDVLENLSPSSHRAVIARAAMTCVVLFSYPLAFNSMRASFEELFLIQHGWYKPNKQFHNLALTVALGILTLVPGASLEDIGIVLDYKGALLGGWISYGFPALMYLKLGNRLPQCCSFSRCCWICVRNPKYQGISEIETSSSSVGDLLDTKSKSSSEDDKVEVGIPTSPHPCSDAAYLLTSKAWIFLSYFFLFWTIAVGTLETTETTLNVMRNVSN